MKQFASSFTHGVQNGSVLRRQVHSSQSPQEVIERVNGFFASAVPLEEISGRRDS
jgi:hypothetical protein